MKFTSKQDIEVPVDFVWQELTDFEQFEREAMRRGADVERLANQRHAASGLAWRLRFALRGKQRRVDVHLVERQEQTMLDYGIDSPPVAGGARIDLVALSPQRTRLMIATDFRPKTLAARILIQSLRLAKGRTQRKYDAAVALLGAKIEERWHASRS